MTSETYGGGSWDNPDHHARPPRPAAPAVKTEAFCEAAGPNGWTCDRAPHSDDRHKADEGPSWGADWDTPTGNLEPLERIHALAQAALEGPYVWQTLQVALKRIEELSRG
jgi:hypothetical protein